MRVRLPMRRVALFAGLLTIALLAFLPMRLVLGVIHTGMTARDVTGSIWSARLTEARIGPLALGDLDARINPLSLLVGEARMVVARGGAAPDRLVGNLGAARDRQLAENVSGVIPIDGSLGILPIAAIQLTDVTVAFRDGQCDRAEGMVQARLSGDMGGLALPAAMDGAARCDRGTLLLPLRSGSGAESVMLRIHGDGAYDAEIRIQATEPAIIARLTAAGFAPGPAGYGMTIKGRF